MTRIPPKKLTLRAFKIENPSLTEPHSGILGLLQQVLTPESIVAVVCPLMPKTPTGICWQTLHGQLITPICLV